MREKTERAKIKKITLVMFLMKQVECNEKNHYSRNQKKTHAFQGGFWGLAKINIKYDKGDDDQGELEVRAKVLFLVNPGNFLIRMIRMGMRQVRKIAICARRLFQL
jgi:hypothetical protein